MRGADAGGLEPPAKRRCSGEAAHSSPVLHAPGARSAAPPERPLPACGWVFNPAAGGAPGGGSSAAERGQGATHAQPPPLQPWGAAAGLAAFAEHAEVDGALAADLRRASGLPPLAPPPRRAVAAAPRDEQLQPQLDGAAARAQPVSEAAEEAVAVSLRCDASSPPPTRAAQPAAPAGRADAPRVGAPAAHAEGLSASQELLASPPAVHGWRGGSKAAAAARAATAAAAPADAAANQAQPISQSAAPPPPAPPSVSVPQREALQPVLLMPPPSPPPPAAESFFSPPFAAGAYGVAAMLPCASGGDPDSERGCGWQGTPGSLPAAALLQRFEDTAAPHGAAPDTTIVPETMALLVPESPALLALQQQSAHAPVAPAAPEVTDIFALGGGDVGAALQPPPQGSNHRGGLLFSYDAVAGAASQPPRSAAAAAGLLPAWQHDGATVATTTAQPSWGVGGGVSITTASGLQVLPASRGAPAAAAVPGFAVPASQPAPTIGVYCDEEEVSPAALRPAQHPPAPTASMPPQSRAASLFSTGGGRAITVSAAAMARGAAFFGDNVEHPAAAPLPVLQRVASGFQAAGSGQALTVSAQSLAQRSALFGSDGAGDAAGKGAAAAAAAAPVGFALATGAAVAPPSAAAAARGAALLSDASTGKPAGAGSRFASASGATLPPPSAASAASAAAIFADSTRPPALHAAAPPYVGGFRPPSRTPLAATPSPAVHSRGRGRFVAPKAITPSPLAPHNGPRAPGSSSGARKSGSPARRLPALSPFAAPPLPPVLPPINGPMHDLRAPLRAAGLRLPMRAFFGGALPLADAAPPGARPLTWLPETRADSAVITAASAGNVALPVSGPFGPFTHALAQWTLVARHGASERLATPEWVANHWRFIVWKLACYERAYPALFVSHRALSVDRVLDELRMRYEREHNRAQRPILRRVFEGDSPAAVPMCLLVCGIRVKPMTHEQPPQPPRSSLVDPVSNDAGDAGGPLKSELELELSDGWYPIRANIDATLTAAVRSGKIAVGDKLFVSCAEKIGGDVPAPPLEAYSSMSLHIGANGTRRAPWDSRLGRLSFAPLIALRNVRQGAGAVPACAVTISRVYSLVYLESAEVEDAQGVVTKSKTMRSAAAEFAHAAEFDARAEAVRDGASALAIEKAQREMDARRHGQVLQSTRDAQHEQRAAAAEQAALAAQVNFEVQAAMEEARVMPRDVVAILKLHVVGCGVPGSGHFGEAHITVWRPDEDTLSTLREGSTFVVSNLCAASKLGTGREGGPLELSAMRSRWLKARPGFGALSGLVSGYTPRQCVPLSTLGAPPPADVENRVAEARRAAAVAAACRGGGAEACNAAAFRAGFAATVPTVAAGSRFDAVGILVHAAAIQQNGNRGQHQFGFFVDASLVHASTEPGAGVDPALIDLAAITLRCSHEGGFLPWPADTTASFPVIMLQHAKYLQYDAANRVRVADVWESAEWAVAPKFPAPGANISAGSSLSAGLVAAALQAAQWAEASAPLLLALRERAIALTSSSAPPAAQVLNASAALWSTPSQAAAGVTFAEAQATHRPTAFAAPASLYLSDDWDAEQIDSIMAAAGALGTSAGAAHAAAAHIAAGAPEAAHLGAASDTQAVQTLTLSRTEATAVHSI